MKAFASLMIEDMNILRFCRNVQAERIIWYNFMRVEGTIWTWLLEVFNTITTNLTLRVRRVLGSGPIGVIQIRARSILFSKNEHYRYKVLLLIHSIIGSCMSKVLLVLSRLYFIVAVAPSRFLSPSCQL